MSVSRADTLKVLSDEDSFNADYRFKTAFPPIRIFDDAPINVTITRIIFEGTNFLMKYSF